MSKAGMSVTKKTGKAAKGKGVGCLVYTADAADEEQSLVLTGELQDVYKKQQLEALHEASGLHPV